MITTWASAAHHISFKSGTWPRDFRQLRCASRAKDSSAPFIEFAAAFLASAATPQRLLEAGRLAHGRRRFTAIGTICWCAIDSPLAAAADRIARDQDDADEQRTEYEHAQRTDQDFAP